MEECRFNFLQRQRLQLHIQQTQVLTKADCSFAQEGRWPLI